MLRKRGLYTAGSRLDAFRHVSRASSEEKDHHVIVNCLRRAIRQERGGHISRLAAYDADTDRFLILNVSRYKYLARGAYAGCST